MGHGQHHPGDAQTRTADPDPAVDGVRPASDADRDRHDPQRPDHEHRSALGAWAHDNGNLALTDPDGDDVLWVCVSGGDSTWDCDSERSDLPPLHLSSQLVAECA